MDMTRSNVSASHTPISVKLAALRIHDSYSTQRLRQLHQAIDLGQASYRQRYFLSYNLKQQRFILGGTGGWMPRAWPMTIELPQAVEIEAAAHES